MNHVISVFISHSWSYSGHFDTLYSWVFEEAWESDGIPISFLDHSVPRDDPIHNARNTAELYRRILERVEASDVVVCPTGMYATHSTWIERELQGAKTLGRPVLGVNPWGQQRKSSVVQDKATETVGWNKASVVGGIWRLAKE